MDELSFVTKSFIISLLLIAAMQIRVGEHTLENSAHLWLTTSAEAGSLQKVSAGAVLMIRNGLKMGTEFVAKTFGHDSTSRAGRLNMEFKRSARYDEEHPKTDRNN